MTTQRINVLKSAGILYYIDGENLIVDNEDGTFTNITGYTDTEFKAFLGF